MTASFQYPETYFKQDDGTCGFIDQ